MTSRDPESSGLASPQQTAGGMPSVDDAAVDGNRLIVRRGGDVSRLCFCCGQKSLAQVTCHLRINKSGVFHKAVAPGSGGSLMLILDALEFVLYFFMLVADIPASRKRKLTYGPCTGHLKKRRLMIIAAPLCLVASVAFFTFVFAELSTPVYLGLPAAILGMLCFVAALALHQLTPGPALASENEKFLWIKGGAKVFLEAYPPQAKAQ